MSEESGSQPIAVFGDWHGDQNFALTAIRSAARADAKVLVDVGDFPLDWPGLKRGRYEKRLNTLLLERGMKLVVSPGNHDNVSVISLRDVQDDGLISWRSNIKVLPKGGRTVISSLRFGGLGGAFSVDKAWRREGKDWWADEEPTARQAEQLIAGGDLDVLITHDVPSGVQMNSSLDLPAAIIDQADRTRILLRETVDRIRPPHVFCGHWHQRVISEIAHSDGRVTRVDVLASEQSTMGNGVLVYPGEPPLRIEPLPVSGT